MGINTDLLNKKVIGEILGREVYGFCDDRKEDELKTTCYMMYPISFNGKFKFSEADFVAVMKEWAIKKHGLELVSGPSTFKGPYVCYLEIDNSTTGFNNDCEYSSGDSDFQAVYYMCERIYEKIKKE